MNYVTEINLFYERMETSPIPPPAIALWFAMMHIAGRAGWPRDISIPVGTLSAMSGLERRGVYRARVMLRDAGLIEFRERSGNQCAVYRIIPLGTCCTDLSHKDDLLYKSGTQTGEPPEPCCTDLSHKENLLYNFDTQTEEPPEPCCTDLSCKQNLLYNFDTQTEEPPEPCCTDLSHKRDLQYKNDTQVAVCSTDLAHKPPKSEKPPIYIYNKDKYTNKGGCGGKKRNDGAKSKSPGNDAKSKSPKKKPEFDLSFIGDGTWENLVESWLDYKRSRSESYKSELSVKKFHTMLRNLSRSDPTTARRIIDKSIANNWAGIFELTESDSRPRGQPSRPAAGHPATGQRIGQIKQPEDEERRRKLLEKFGGSNDTGKNKT